VFLGTNEFPTARFVITNVAEQPTDSTTHLITGNLTLRGVEKSIKFGAKVNVAEGQPATANASFLLNRADFNVRYGSKSLIQGLGDNFINDEVLMSINLTANPAPAAAPPASN
jgi:polyisoprenoid-binding protein YceI